MPDARSEIYFFKFDVKKKNDGPAIRATGIQFVTQEFTGTLAGTENMSEPKPNEAETRGGSCAPAPGSADFDDYPEEYWDDEDVCEMCGGDGVIEYLDHPEVWGEDCPSYNNHLLPCPECRRRELAERRKANPPNDKLTHGGPTQ